VAVGWRNGSVKTIGALAIVATTMLLPAPVVQAKDSHEPAPAHPSSFFSIMVGANFPDDDSHAASGECFFAGGFMMNRHFGYQVELDVTNYSGDADAEPGSFYAIAGSLRLALPIAFVEPYVLGGAGVGLGAPGASEHTSYGFPVHAAAGIDFNFGTILVGLEVRQVWLTANSVDFDALLVTGKLGFRF
jgi:hypothetical protein